MLLLASGSALIDAFGCQPWLGQLLCPRSRNRIVLPRWAADNAAFSRFDADAYMAMIERIASEPTRPIFVTVPDVVSDAGRTTELWEMWRQKLQAYRLPLAYVLQDGVENQRVPWEECAAVFIGGSTAFKVGAVARFFVAEAKLYGRWVHMGRVNTMRRLKYAQQIGCDSIDGTCFSRFANQTVGRFTRVNSNGTLDL